MIREFQPEDWPEFVRLMRRLHEEGGLSNLKLSEKSLLAFLQRMDLFHVMAFDEEERAVGDCIGFVSDTFFSPEKVGWLHIFYVVPESRGGLIGKRMMKMWEEWCRAHGAREIWASQSTGIEVERMRGFLEVMGYRVVGVIARKEA